MIKEKRYCDRCGEEIERGDILPIKTSNLSLRKKRWTCAVSSLAGRSYYSNVELCCSCEKSLKAWFKNKQKNGVFESLDDESLKIKIKYQDGVKPLEKTAKGDLIDLAASETVIMRKGDYRMIPLGVAMELPPGHFAKVYPRSSTYKKHGIIMANSVGIVDNTYKGDADIWQFPAVALRDTCIVQGTRIAQFEICKAQVPIEFEAVEKLGNPGRGGFGSTGD